MSLTFPAAASACAESPNSTVNVVLRVERRRCVALRLHGRTPPPYSTRKEAPLSVVDTAILGAMSAPGRGVGRWTSVASGSGLFACWTALALIGAISWARTAGPRRGRSPPDLLPFSGGRTSRATYLPGTAGVCLAAAAVGAAWGRLASPVLAGTLAAAGGFV